MDEELLWPPLFSEKNLRIWRYKGRCKGKAGKVLAQRRGLGRACKQSSSACQGLSALGAASSPKVLHLTCPSYILLSGHHG